VEDIDRRALFYGLFLVAVLETVLGLDNVVGLYRTEGEKRVRRTIFLLGRSGYWIYGGKTFPGA